MEMLMSHNNSLSLVNDKDRFMQRIKQSFSGFVLCGIRFSFVTVKYKLLKETVETYMPGRSNICPGKTF
jgi:hypothetical protein